MCHLIRGEDHYIRTCSDRQGSGRKTIKSCGIGTHQLKELFNINDIFLNEHLIGEDKGCLKTDDPTRRFYEFE